MRIHYILILLILIPIVTGLEECPRYAQPKDIPCVVISTWRPVTGCTGTLSYFNQENQSVYNTSWESAEPYCLAVFNYSTLGTVTGNSSIDDSVITIEGDDDEMILSILIFLLTINLIVFLLPFFVNSFTPQSEGANYMIKRFFWIGALLLAWFNMTIFRQLADDWGLGIDNFLIGYWWLFTMGAFSMIFVLLYVGVVGGIKLLQESKMRQRIGDNDYK